MSECILQFGVSLTAAGAMLMPIFIPADYRTERAAIMVALGMTSLVSSLVFLVFGS